MILTILILLNLDIISFYKFKCLYMFINCINANYKFNLRKVLIDKYKIDVFINKLFYLTYRKFKLFF